MEKRVLSVPGEFSALFVLNIIEITCTNKSVEMSKAVLISSRFG